MTRRAVTAVAEAPARSGFRDAFVQGAIASAREKRSLSPGRIIFTIVLCLLVGHMTISAYFPSFAINAAGIALVTLILGHVLFIKKDVFAFVLIVFSCSSFQYANGQGGLFNLVAFALGMAYLMFQSNIRETGARDGLITTLVAILLASDLLGLILRNPMPLWVIFLEAASFTAFMLMFVITSHLNLTEARLRKLMVVSACFIPFNFLVSLNQYYAFLLLDTPLLGLTPELFYSTSNAFGVFGSASSNGQYAMMMFALLAPLVAATASRKTLGVKALVFVPVLVLCGLTLVLANMRASFVEVVLIIVIYFMMFSMRYRRFFRNSKYMNMASIGAAAFLISTGVWIGFQNLEADFRAVEINSVSAVQSGEALNRGGVWQLGVQVVKQGSWWVGYGHGNAKSNLIAWGGKWTGTGQMDPMLRSGEIIGGGHLHNLYLALPTLYGWGGAVAYVMLFLIVVFRLLGAVRRYSLGQITVVACLGFLVSLSFFLLDEVKAGNAVQTINYPMIVWIWLGLGLAAWRTLKAEMAAARMKRPAEAEPRQADAEEELPEDPSLPDQEAAV